MKRKLSLERLRDTNFVVAKIKFGSITTCSTEDMKSRIHLLQLDMQVRYTIDYIQTKISGRNQSISDEVHMI